MYRQSNTLTFRYDVIRNGDVVGSISAHDAPEIQCDSTSELKMSLRGSFRYDWKGRFDFLTDRLRPVMVLNGEDYPLGTFVITTESPERASGADIAKLEGYSLLYLLRRKRTEGRLHLAAGTNYITAILNLLEDAGITDYDEDETEYTLAADREDWDEGTPYLTIINTLLSEISYNSLWVKLDGTVMLTQYEAPTLANVTHTYTAGRYSLIEPDYKITTDIYGKCNVFRVVCDNPDLSGTLTATSVNSEPTSPYSTVHLGRILHLERVDSVPDADALQEIADRLRAESLQSTQTAEFYTALMPHETFETVALDNGEAHGIYRETGWRMALDASGQMTHKAKRVIV